MSDDGELLEHGLCYQEKVERVLVMRWEMLDRERVLAGDIQRREAVTLE